MKQKNKRNYKIHNFYICAEPRHIQQFLNKKLNEINENPNLKYIKTILQPSTQKDSIIIVYKEYF